MLCTGLGDILIKTSVPSLIEVSCSWKPVSPLGNKRFPRSSSSWTWGAHCRGHEVVVLLPGRVCRLSGACRMSRLGCPPCPCSGMALQLPPHGRWWHSGARLPQARHGAGILGELALPHHAAPRAGRHVLRQRDRPPDKGFIFMQLSPCPELCLCLWQKGSYPRSEHCLEPARGIGFQFQQRLSFPFFSYPSSHHRIIPIPISLPPSPFLSLPL